jgi:intracellular multiplication protein IcmE
MVNEDQQDSVPDFEPENDFSEFEDEKSEGSLSSTLKNSPLIKLGLIAAGLIVVVGGIVLLGGQEEKLPQSNVGATSNLKETPGTKELSPVMQEAMEEFNEQNLQAAVEQGGSVMPVPIEPPKTFLPVPADAGSSEDPLQRWRQMQEERLRAQREQEQMQTQMNQTAQGDPAAEQAKAALSQAMIAQMTQILTDNTHKISYMSVSTLKKEADQTGAGLQGTSFGAGQVGAATPAEPLEIVIPAGTIQYAQLLNEANSDVKGPIVALLAQGPFSGSRVLGSFERMEELLVLKFSTLVSKEGFSVPINSFAIDPDTTLTGMATDVDHRYWRRVILPAAAEFLQGVGEAIAEKGTTTVTVNEGDTTTSTRDTTNIDTEQELAKGAEKAFSRVGEILNEEGSNVQVLVIVKAGTPLGILFMEPVTKQAIEQARFGTQHGAVNQQQQAQQNNQFPGFMGGGGQPFAGGLSPALLQGLQSQQNIQNSNTQNQYMSSSVPAQ